MYHGYNDETGGLDGEKERCGSAVGLLIGLSEVVLGLARSLPGLGLEQSNKTGEGFRRGRCVGSTEMGTGKGRKTATGVLLQIWG